jgi:hypothetical protein
MLPKGTIEDLFHWLISLVIPISRINELHKQGAMEDSSVVFKSWLWPIFISMAVDVLAFVAIGGPSEKEATYYLLYFVILVSKLMMVPLIAATLLFALTSKFNSKAVLLASSVYIIYSPIFSIIEIPSMWRYYAMFRYFHNQPSDLYAALTAISQHPSEFSEAIRQSTPKMPPFFDYVSYLSDVLYIITIVIFGYFLAAPSNVRAIVAYTVGCFSFYIAYVPQLCLDGLQWLTALSLPHA